MRRKSSIILSLLLLCSITATYAQKSLINTSASPYVHQHGVDMGSVQWTKGFWAERYEVCRQTMVPALWKTYHDAEKCHSFKNFEIAAGLDTGVFIGPSFHDGDFYKTLEAVAGLYAVTKDTALDRMMDEAIAVIAKAQRKDGYVYTKNIIEQRQTGKQGIFDDKLSFEAYNFGHLMTAACIHYRATGKTSLLEIAKKATDFLIGFYDTASPEQARNAICPSHYMGIIEMYRTTSDKKYLALARKLIDIRGLTPGTDDNSDRVPFRDMKRVAGHAVRANYLLAGVADVYAETGDTTLLRSLHLLWDDIINKKMYVTGGCGALYDGVSVDGTSYNPDTVQKVHQSYGRNYQLPNHSAHNETCANIGNLLWNRRMLELTGEAKYADIVELTLYNSILSGVSMNGEGFFYTNPLAASQAYPYQLRWMGGRQPYIALSNCCPPNTVRTIAEVSNYMYSQQDAGISIDMYGGNILKTRLKDGSRISLEQKTDYPWDGTVSIVIKEAPGKTMDVALRIPGWCQSATVTVNGKKVTAPVISATYHRISRQWKAGDQITLTMDMPATLITANPLVEETRNQVAVKRGPVVYCLESPDLNGQPLNSVMIPADVKFHPTILNIANGRVMGLQGEARVAAPANWQNTLYQPLNAVSRPQQITLIPYYAWANRGVSDMSVWLPLSR
ncbi:aceric acid hydrolase [Chitinophaga rhizophila]|uniref:Glycoside hydrolase family 127 protein n=1 Tax=Chitinophaga rhizophila TaxID=2866212 RepID=A0ABS7GB28_9BACT|nr:glycoside hydrolase family 127 protein [Chitinophaga rhizophila]MBW8684621.1 glycoside hydrolase family 127 protein [Chitinophaga rhizophila]